MTILPPGLRAQCEILTSTCVGDVILGFGNVDSARTSDGRPARECAHTLIVSSSAMLETRVESVVKILYCQ